VSRDAVTATTVGQLDARLAAVLRACLVLLVDDREAVTVTARWESATKLTLTVAARAGADFSQVVGARGRMLRGILEPLAQRAGGRHGVHVALAAVEVPER